MSLNNIQNEIVDQFAMFNDWLDKYDYLIELGNELPDIDPAFKTDEYLINGCQSKVWLNAEFRDGRIWYQADSDAIIVRGIVALLVKALNGQPPGEIIQNDLYFIDEIGLKQNLSPTRSNGLVAMVKKMKLYALAYQAKNN
ncbi:MAG: SufE family protein [Bacteroidales bacterium]